MERNSATELAGLTGVLVALVIGLHKVGGIPGLAVDWSDPIEWVQSNPPDLLVGAGLRQVGLVIGYWFLASGAGYAVARAVGRPARWIRFVTLPVMRGLVDRTVATSLAVSLLGVPFAPNPAPDAPVVFEPSDDGIPVPHVRVIDPAPAVPSVPSVSSAPVVEPPAMSLAVPPVAVRVADVEAKTHLVVRGDNLWSIAAAHFESQPGPLTNTDRIADYWRSVIRANRTNLRSGDPNLIYPGELIVLPPVEVP